MSDILFRLQRFITPEGTFGMLMHPNAGGIFVPVAVTLEPVYGHTVLGREPKMKDGVHYCDRTVFHKHGYETYEVHIVGHTRILFHIGNYQHDTEGCILVAETFTDFNPAPGIQEAVVGDSAKGFNEFMKLAGDVPSFFLDVRTAPWT